MRWLFAFTIVAMTSVTIAVMASDQPNSVQPITREIQAIQPWNDTGISIVAGEQVSIKANPSRKVYVGGPAPISYETPAGQPLSTCQLYATPAHIADMLAPGLPCWSLVGRIGQSGQPFEVGVQLSFLADASGELYLSVNDNDWGADNDNSGSWSVQISVPSGMGNAPRPLVTFGVPVGVGGVLVGLGVAYRKRSRGRAVAEARRGVDAAPRGVAAASRPVGAAPQRVAVAARAVDAAPRWVAAALHAVTEAPPTGEIPSASMELAATDLEELRLQLSSSSAAKPAPDRPSASLELAATDLAAGTRCLLAVVAGPTGSEGRMLEVKKEPATVGSGDRCALRLPSAPGVASEHARIWLREGRVMLHHLAEGHTTIVSGRQAVWASLDEMDDVVIGPYVLRLTIEHRGWVSPR